MSKRVEAEGGELVIRNSNGDVAIIPKDKSRRVKGFIKSGNYEAVDRVVAKLPKIKTK